MFYTMAIEMEVYNIAIKVGFNLNMGSFSSMTNAVFPAALTEASYMGIFVFFFSNLYGNHVGAVLSGKVSDPKKDNPYFCQLMRQAGTIDVMCSTMSMAASILFNVIPAEQSVTQLPAKVSLCMYQSCDFFPDLTARTAIYSLHGSSTLTSPLTSSITVWRVIAQVLINSTR